MTPNAAKILFPQPRVSICVFQGLGIWSFNSIVALAIPHLTQETSWEGRNPESEEDLEAILRKLGLYDYLKVSADVQICYAFLRRYSEAGLISRVIAYPSLRGLVTDEEEQYKAYARLVESCPVPALGAEHEVSFAQFKRDGKWLYLAHSSTIEIHANSPQRLRSVFEERALASLGTKAKMSKVLVSDYADAVQKEVKAEARGIVSGLNTGPFYAEQKAEEQTYATIWDQALACKRPSKLKSIEMDAYEYAGSQVEAFGGIPQDTSYTYISSTFLNGLVNYGKNHHPFLIARYGISQPGQTMDVIDHAKGTAGTPEECWEKVRQVYQAHADATLDEIHPVFGGDDWLLFYETSSSYIAMWYDLDCSDCSIDRYSKESCLDVGIENIEHFVLEALLHWKENSMRYCWESTGLIRPIVIQPEKTHIRGWLRG